MRSFLVLCFAAVAIHAAPQYNYQAGGSGGGGFSQSFGQSIGIGGGGGFQSFQAAPSFPNVQRQQHHRVHQQLAPSAPVVTKNFYIHSAPEDDDDVQEDIQQRGTSHKHYNVVFIKAPTQTLRRTAVQLAQALNEEKTVIYVLSKKPDANEIRTVLQQQSHFEPKKPEVFFIKYKTPEEAAYAQQQIQSQYDALGGSTQISDEGIAPISSVIGTLGDSGSIGSGSLGSGSSISETQIGGGSVQSTYLPATARH